LPRNPNTLSTSPCHTAFQSISAVKSCDALNVLVDVVVTVGGSVVVGNGVAFGNGIDAEGGAVVVDDVVNEGAPVGIGVVVVVVVDTVDIFRIKKCKKCFQKILCKFLEHVIQLTRLLP
jgi:hypothetical protein